MVSIPNESHQMGCYNEYDPLKRVIVCQPQFLKVREEINKKQTQAQNDEIQIEKALKQHQEFLSTLQRYGIEVISVPYHKRYPEQVFTRDIGFTLGKTIFVADMANAVREGEEKYLKLWLEEDGISYYNIIGDRIEGGDLLIDEDTIYVGLSKRTNQQAINHLKELLHKQFHLYTIDFHDKFLHLDCVFNIVSSDHALIYPKALHSKDIATLQSRFEFIEVPEGEQATLGTNVLSIGNNRIISLPQNQKVNQQLRQHGFEVIEVDFLEVVQAGGSFRCCSLPIHRSKENK
ncbi:dimethylarginine dimethylaminohydrolase family protein [Bacillus tuaregi]|uniref:dimethylarginine dimethylaminohydrolase family protein n=1 Tax=Bacillus tuaregi TaxID=1816695 RepID=UPI0008F933C7|nr:arginine deiminase family protein [Bacillus tuaregi]